jgi:hypothetical protein
VSESAIRQNVLAALELLGGKANRDLICEHTGESRRSVGVCLGLCVQDGLLTENDGMFSLVSVNGNGNGRSNGNGNGAKLTIRQYTEGANRRIELPEIARGRDGKRVGVYALPDEFEDVVQVLLYHAGGSFKVPLFGNLRICIGAGVPQWSADQESNPGITEVRVVFKGGQYRSFSVLPGQWVTIAPEES